MQASDKKNVAVKTAEQKRSEFLENMKRVSREFGLVLV